MTVKNFWEIFRQTGEPVCYLLYRASGSSGELARAGRADVSGGRGQPGQTGRSDVNRTAY